MEEEVLSSIRPTSEEEARIRSAVEELERMVRAAALELGAEVEPVLVGSVAKGTHLRSPDIDMFLLFPSDTPREVLETKGLAVGKAILEGEERYAEHPYMHGEFMGLDTDIVPCYRVEDASQRMSAVDRTPFHNAYVVEKMGGGQRDQVRLLKQFMKGTGVYGAEAQIRGFSGYLCELLVLRFGSFRGVLEAASEWKPTVRLSLGGDDGREFLEPLVFIDPVDKNRNVSSAVSMEKLSTFIYASKRYLEEGRREFFFPNPVRPKGVDELRAIARERGAFLVALSFQLPELVDDVLYPQLDRCQRVVTEALEREGFRVMCAGYHRSDAWHVLFQLEGRTLSGTKTHMGPPVWHRNVESFKAKWTGSERAVSAPFIRGDRWYVEVRREHSDAVQFLKDTIPAMNLGKNINAAIAGGCDLLIDDEVLERLDPGFLTQFFDKRMPWEW